MKKKREQTLKENRPSKHHLTPKSRGGCDDEKNIKQLTWRMHKRWNDLFSNFDLSCRPEAIILIIKYFGGVSSFVTATDSKNEKRVKKAWKKIFGQKNDQKVITLIEKNWSSIKKKNPQEIMVLFKNINLKSEEIIILIQYFGGKQFFIFGKRTSRKFDLEKAWNSLFGDKTDEEVIQIIKKDWTEKK